MTQETSPERKPEEGDSSHSIRIHIVDDQPVNLRIMEQLAAALRPDVEVRTFTDPRLALEAAAQNPPDLVISDYRMPAMDGAAFIAALRKLPDCGDVPVVIVTMYHDKKFRYKALEAGATDFLLSPIDHIEFGIRIRNLLLLSEHRRTIREHSRALEHQIKQFESAVKQREAAEAALHQAQKLEAVGQLTAGIAHDFNNILTAVVGNLDLIESRIGEDPRLHKLIDAAQRAAERATTLTSQLLVFSRRKALFPEVIAADRLIRDFEVLIRPAIGEAVALEVHAAPDLWSCYADPAQLESAVLNLVINARDAMPTGGILSIDLQNVALDRERAAHLGDIAPGRYLTLAVTDNGTGIRPELMKRLFEPFFTTKEVGKGTGLGLAMVWGFVKQSGGHAVIDSEFGRGTTVTLYLPKTDRDRGNATDEEPSPQRDEAPRGAGTILVVEDDPEVLAVTSETLKSCGYDVVIAHNGVEALAQLHGYLSQGGLSCGEPVPCLLFSDVVMPQGISGIELAREAMRLQPDLKVLLTSGYPDEILARHGATKNEFPLLNKPYRQAALAEAVHALLG